MLRCDLFEAVAAALSTALESSGSLKLLHVTQRRWWEACFAAEYQFKI
jgi:hypothetical protein